MDDQARFASSRQPYLLDNQCVVVGVLDDDILEHPQLVELCESALQLPDTAVHLPFHGTARGSHLPGVLRLQVPVTEEVPQDVPPEVLEAPQRPPLNHLSEAQGKRLLTAVQ